MRPQSVTSPLVKSTRQHDSLDRELCQRDSSHHVLKHEKSDQHVDTHLPQEHLEAERDLSKPIDVARAILCLTLVSIMKLSMLRSVLSYSSAILWIDFGQSRYCGTHRVRTWCQSRLTPVPGTRSSRS